MTNGEEEKKEVNEVPNQSPPAKSSINPIFIILGVVVVLCIGAVAVIFITGGGQFNFNIGDTGPQYTNQTVNGATFKIPVGYEKMKEDVNGMIEFKNDTNKFIRIQGVTEKYDIYTWGLAVSTVLGGVSGNKVDLNGTGSYRFETEDIIIGGPTDQTVYVYALNLEGKSFIIVLSKSIENPNEFLINMTST